MLEDLFRLAKSVAFHGAEYGDSDDMDDDDMYDYELESSDDGADVDCNPSFMGRPPESDSDGYISDGKITLETVNGNKQTFDCYNKGGNLFVYEDGQWKRISGSGVVNIHHVIYKKT